MVDVSSALHRGVDLHAPPGTPVVAMFDAIVAAKGEDTYSGKYLVLAGRRKDGGFPDPSWWFVPNALGGAEGSAGPDDSGWRAYYLHLQAYGGVSRPGAPSNPGFTETTPIDIGTIVNRGQVIGYSGNTGLNPKTGAQVDPHLHIALEYVTDGYIDSRVFVDPVKVLGLEVLSGRAPRSHLPPNGGAQTDVNNAVIVTRDQGGGWTQERLGTVVMNNTNGVMSVNLGQGVSIAGKAEVDPSLFK